MFQLKFCLITFQTCSLLCVSVLKCSILAIILLNIVIRSKFQEGNDGLEGAKKFQVGSCPYFPRL